MSDVEFHNPENVPAEALHKTERFLRKGEKVHPGDKKHMGDNTWFPASFACSQAPYDPSPRLTYKTTRP